jgi:RimJ/RimL family protein N-acetyltransferase
MSHGNVRIETARLVLRELEESDFETVHSFASDPDTVGYMKFGPNSPEDTRAFLARVAEHRAENPRLTFELAVTLKDGGAQIGDCGLHITDAESGQAFIGYILHRDFHGRGYGTEAAGGLLRFGFEQMGLHRVYATCDVRNRPCARVMEKCGMRREGCLREHVRVKGTWRDSYLYAILESEWPAGCARGNDWRSEPEGL